ncbi:MAG TPA: methylated-DNA--[protein]-cysteine S-methyltransferase [Candidatus Limnocylindrales bacterium]|nr:methylated-DNA--[protein]-cysteine S-methyltransferase [Candidatus Limnocylindrales bacterium]
MKTEKFISLLGSEFGNQKVEALLRRSQRRVDNALKQIRRPQVAVGVVNSPLGDLLVALSERGIVLIHYLPGGDDLESTIAKLRLVLDPVEDRSSVNEIGAEIRRYLDGNADALRRNVDLSLAASPFQKKVLYKLLEVPRGAVVSYQALGAAAGAPKGARAVGNALHNNPVPIYVPCHRVITSSGGIGGYGGGAARKLQLLRSEGFALGKADERLPHGVVWGHKGTKIYCRPNCRSSVGVDRTRVLFFADPGEAKAAGLRPCKICRPA